MFVVDFAKFAGRFQLDLQKVTLSRLARRQMS